MAPRCPEQSRARVFGDVDQAGGGPHPTSLAQMIDAGRCPFLGDLGIAQRAAASLGELLTARPAAQEPCGPDRRLCARGDGPGPGGETVGIQD
jgi:hypothetical protein